MRHMEVNQHISLEHVMPHNSVTKQNKIDFKKINYYKRLIRILNKMSFTNI